MSNERKYTIDNVSRQAFYLYLRERPEIQKMYFEEKKQMVEKHKQERLELKIQNSIITEKAMLERHELAEKYLKILRELGQTLKIKRGRPQKSKMIS